MPAPLSVIIPTLNTANELPATAASLMEGVTSGLIGELIVSDGGSQDGTEAIANRLGARVISGTPGRGGQFGRGVSAAKGDWLLLLHADTHLSPGWVEHAEDHMENFSGKAGYFRLKFRAAGVWPLFVAAGANMRSRWVGLPYGDQGLLIEARLLKENGGMPDIPLMEDVALARALKGKLRFIPVEAMTSAARYQRDGWLSRVAKNLWALASYFAGKSPNSLAKKY